MKKNLLLPAIILIVGLIGIGMTYNAFKSMKEEIALLKTSREALFQVNENTVAIVAALKRENDQLKLAKAAAKDMGGKLVGGVTLVVPRDTVFIPLASGATTTADSVGTRYSTRTFQLTEGTARVDAAAPPTGPLLIGLNWTPHPFEPEVGLVRKNDSYFWTVSWKGQTVEAKDAFYTPPKPSLVGFVAGASVSATYAVPVASFSGAAYLGADINVKKGYVLGIDLGMNVPTLSSFGTISVEKSLGGIF